MKITGKIQNIGIKGHRYSFLVEGKWLSVFVNDYLDPETQELIKGLKVGDECEFEAEYKESQSGWKGYNIVNIVPVADIHADTREAPKPNVQPGEHKKPISREEEAQKRKECSIILQAIMKACGPIAASLGVTVDEKVAAWDRLTKEGIKIYKDIMGED